MEPSIEILLHIYLFVFGLLFGSFFNVVGLRLADKESIVTPRSHCTKCQRTLKISELIPVFSYLFQKGKCKECGSKISIIYPAFELLTAILFAIAPFMVGWSKELFVVLALISLVMIVTVSDIYKMIIPNKVLLFFTPLIIIIRLFVPTDPWFDAYLGAVIGFLILFIIAVVSRGGMGGGDIKYFGVLGFFLGVKAVVLTLIVASFLGLIYGVIMRMSNKLKKKQAIPFGPFIGIAALISYFTSTYIWDLYLSFI